VRPAPPAATGRRAAAGRRGSVKKNVQNVSNIYKNVEMLKKIVDETNIFKNVKMLKKSLMTPHF
jgi:hypothetical protein